jgi:hypothetical protein
LITCAFVRAGGAGVFVDVLPEFAVLVVVEDFVDEPVEPE